MVLALAAEELEDIAEPEEMAAPIQQLAAMALVALVAAAVVAKPAIILAAVAVGLESRDLERLATGAVRLEPVATPDQAAVRAAPVFTQF